MIQKANETWKDEEKMSDDMTKRIPSDLKESVLCYVKYNDTIVLGQVRAISNHSYRYCDQDGSSYYVSCLNPVSGCT